MINLQNNLLKLDFTPVHQHREAALNHFHSSELGKLHKAIPWSELAKAIKIPRKSATGRPPLFDLQGKLALMFLKSYLNISDRDLMQRLGSDYCVQFFCGVYFEPGAKPPHFKMISEIRVELGRYMNWDEFQQQLAAHWCPYMENIEEVLADATCYETHMRYPTDVKLLWESCLWARQLIAKVCKTHHLSMPRSKFSEQAKKQKAYAKRKKPGHKRTQRRIGSLLHLLPKLTEQLQALITSTPYVDRKIWLAYMARIHTVKKVYEQQQDKYRTGAHPKNRIVSLDKEYIRPIVRGKENKRVEFGPKINMIQVDGINFIEHFDFEAFHEGNRLAASIGFHQQLTNSLCECLGADQLYATNANRSWCTQHDIFTSFLPKGPPAKDEEKRKEMRTTLARKRATRMEGSFGVEKQFYGLTRIRARNEFTERLWVFFGVHTANAVRMIAKMEKARQGSINARAA